MSIDDRTPPESRIWPVDEFEEDGHHVAVFEHPDTGLQIRVEELPNCGVWNVEVHQDGSSLYRVGYPRTKHDAQELVLEEIQRCCDGCPRTFDGDTGEWRVEE